VRGRERDPTRAHVGSPTPSCLAEAIWLEPYPDVLIEGIAGEAPGPRGALRTQGSDGPRVRCRSPTPPAAAAGGAGPPRRPQLPGRGGRRDPRHERSRSEQPAPARPRRAREPPAHCAARPRAATSLPTRARGGRAVRHRASGRRRQGHRRVAHRRRLADDAARALRTPRRRGDRTVPAGPRRSPGGPLRIIHTRANGQPAFGCYSPCPHTDIARPYGLLVLTLAGSRIAEIAFFADTSAFPHFGLPRTVATQEG
jgi:hypothetical protein